MIGLLNNNTNNLLPQWYRLFSKKKSYSSIKFYKHLKYIKMLWSIPDIFNAYYNDINYNKLLKSKFVLKNDRYFNNIDVPNIISDVYLLVFINGNFYSELSNYNSSINIELKYDDNTINFTKNFDIFYHLVESFCYKTYFININKNISERPICLLHINDGISKDTVNILQNRYCINILENTKAHIIEYFTDNNKYYSYINNVNTFIYIHNYATLEYTKLSLENNYSYHFNYKYITINSYAKLNSNTFIIGNKIHKDEIRTRLNGVNTSAYINSLSILSNYNNNFVDTYIQHFANNCISDQLHKAIISNNSKYLFSGIIKIKQLASKVSSNVFSQGLLLDNTSQFNTKPQIEIYNRKVHCTHGVILGNINQDQIFYLCSRGIDYISAKKLIINAFFEEIINKINNCKLRKIVFSILKNLI
ncbi:MAG: SufD family Fe-S cluster assembly protein [Candidatus Lightella neohaematopini]|nr:SufD family Fe-S cluster assembly protein [Candidatus Lightella neohaematopini]MCV2528879.1 SufD family Fe-S cluster assembly protein [Candidatus Lightella neohaematopini]